MTVRPRPRLGVYERAFWKHVDQQRLHVQRCDDCGHHWYPPGPSCPECLSREWRWSSVAGTATMLSWAVFHKQYFDTLPTPYTVAAAELPEGPILIADLVSPAPELAVGMRLSVCYETAYDSDGEPFMIYQWRHSEGGGPADE